MPRGVPKNAPGAGRPTLKTESVIEILLANRRLGLSPKTCAGLARISVDSIYRWINDDVDFAAKWADASGQAVKSLHMMVAKKDPWKILKNLDSEVYKDRIEQEIAGRDGDPIKLIVEDFRIGVDNAKEENKV